MDDQPEKQKRRFPTVCERLWEKLKRIGNGNASEGIRKSAEAYDEDKKPK